MKLDIVARAVSEHKGEQGIAAPAEPTETESDGRVIRTFVMVISAGFFVVFIGVIMVTLGKDISWIKKTGSLLAIIGIFVAIFGAMYTLSLGVKRDLSPASPKKDSDEGSAVELPSGEDFVPAASVTESTTRDLDKNKTKVMR